MSRRYRILAIALALLGASALAMSVEGAQTGFEWLGGGGSWVRFGAAAYAAGLIAALVLVALAASLAAKRTGRLAARVAIVAAGTAVAAGGVFIYVFPPLPGMVIDRGVWLYVGGVVLAAAAGLVALRGARRFAV
jgi:hypothetical protein